MLKQAAQAWAFSAVVLLPNYVDLTADTGDARMRSPVAVTPIVLAQFIDIAIVALVAFAFLLILSRLKGREVVRRCLIAALPPLLFVRNLDLLPSPVPGRVILAGAALWAGILIFLLVRYPAVAARFAGFAGSFFAAFAIFAMVMTGQLVRAALWRPGPQSLTAQLPAADPSRPRLVWIVFDELADQPVFESRDPSLQLPNFDRVRSQSTLFSQVIPIASRTVKVILGLQTGHVVTDFSFSTNNRFTIANAGDEHGHLFDPNVTLFGLAHQRGLTTGVIGWYLPYCSTFAGIVSECYWNNEDAQDRGPTAPQASLAQNVIFPLRVLIEQIVAPRIASADFAAWNSQSHAGSVSDIEQHAIAAAATSQADILYLHLPAPHPPAVWDRHTQRFVPGGSYLDSLDISDRILGDILDRLQSQPRWSNTTLIVEGDHSWRTWMWRSLPGWTVEDERISRGGQWDPRPVLLIHDPGQQIAQTVSVPTSLMTVHDRVSAEIETIAQSRKISPEPHATRP
ncbi:MAG TPA: sulfatase-like hydrolase/transferase [Terracidiphilus sp.]|jgi:hypothetical protein|nr:sulfatase-like hydrolase/transferase [Terracidiphilus sp.]